MRQALDSRLIKQLAGQSTALVQARNLVITLKCWVLSGIE